MGKYVPYLFSGSRRYVVEGREVLDRLASSLYEKKMDTHQEQAREHREKVLAFWASHGLAATRDAFAISRATLFRWQSNPVPKSRAHTKGYATRQVPAALVGEINRIRGEHPKLGKEKLAPLLVPFCERQGLPVLSEPTVGRILTQLKKEGKLVASVKLRLNGKTGRLIEKKPKLQVKKERRGGYLPQVAGDLLQLDGVLKIGEGKRRYIFTAVDLYSRVSWSMAFASASSRHGAEFLTHILETTPFLVSHIQTDNGGEFLKEFHRAALEAELVHFFNYVKQPKYQGWVERFNRSKQEEFIDWHLDTLANDLPLFNVQLAEWTRWYNTDRIHRGLNTKTARGVQKYTPLQYLALTAESQTG